jgi:phosphohistidine phosphatase
MDRAPRRLVLVRHAKAESGEEGADHDRRLTSRGERDADATARWLGQQLSSVDHVWVSSARRAQQTWAALERSLPVPGEVVVDRALYLAGGRDVLEHLAAEERAVSLLVGHNPTMEQVVMALTGDLHGLKPGAAAVVEFEPGQAWRGRQVELFTPPR